MAALKLGLCTWFLLGFNNSVCLSLQTVVLNFAELWIRNVLKGLYRRGNGTKLWRCIDQVVTFGSGAASGNFEYEWTPKL
jgi:hypothetical protein